VAIQGGKTEMSTIDELIAKKCATSASFAKAYDEENERLETANAVLQVNNRLNSSGITVKFLF
jgi:hypothetical protein